MDRYKITFETWDKIASAYQEKFMELDLYNDSYDLFCQQIKNSDPSILEIGCGPGNVTKYLLAKRNDFKIEGIDVAPNMIKLAQVNNPQATFKVMDCRKISALEKKYDAIICGFCIPYLSKKDCSKMIKDCSSLLKNNGIFYLSAIEGDYENSGFEIGSTGDKAFVHYYREAYLREKLIENNFEVINFIRINYPKNDGSTQSHLILIAKI